MLWSLQRQCCGHSKDNVVVTRLEIRIGEECFITAPHSAVQSVELTCEYICYVLNHL